MRVPVLLSVILSATIAFAAPPPAKHPILGVWQFSVPGRDCSETFVFGEDGTVHVTSGAELTESEYEIAPSVSAAGFYEYRDKVVRSNGFKDCTGDTTPVGAPAHWYVKFAADRKSFLMCQSETLTSCFGPVKRPAEAAS